MVNLFLQIINEWAKSFPQERTFLRAISLSLGLITALGRKTITRVLASTGKDQIDWAADYRIFSRVKWSACSLFRPILKQCLSIIDEDYITVAYDDTLVKKSGKKIKGTGWARDPLGPSFCNNFVWGMRYLQASILMPLYKDGETPCRGVPVQLVKLPKFKKPNKKASEEKHQQYKELCQHYNSSTTFVRELRYLRNEIDHLGYKNKKLIAVVDGSYCNRTCLNANIENTVIVGRTRKDSRLFFKNNKPSVCRRGKKRFYSDHSVTAEEIRKDQLIPYKNMKIHYGQGWRDARYKELKGVYSKHRTQRTPLRLIVIAPTPYRKTKKSKRSYRDPAYLLTTDLYTNVEILIQKYFDRWQIEVNFKDEKQYMGLGKQQVWSQKSIERTCSFVVATYSALLVASIIKYGDRKDKIHIELPKWRNKQGPRPSCLDLLTIMRRELSKSPPNLCYLNVKITKESMIFKSAA